jgi:hypothetical protein
MTGQLPDFGPAAVLVWGREAVCAVETGAVPELWTSDRRPTGVVGAELERMCARCPVLAQCARQALEDRAESGIYAGVWVPGLDQQQRWQRAMDALRVVAEQRPAA